MEPIISSLPYLAALISLGLGLFGMLYPRGAAAMVGICLNPALPHSISEIRATYGGIFIGISGTALATGSSGAFLSLGMAWSAAALARILSMLMDDALNGKNTGGVVMEAVLGAMCLAPMLLR